MWQTIPSDYFVSKLTEARATLRLPFSVNLEVNERDARPADGPARQAATASGARVVVGRGAVEGQYASLAAAVRDAKSGDVIELRYDGALDEQPLDIANLKLTIRAPRGRSPVVRFRVDDEDLLAERRSMVSVDGGRLSLHNIHLDFTLPRDTTDPWSLFELGHAEGLSFEQCTVTVRSNGENYGPTASIVNVRAGLADSSGMMKDAMPTLKPVEIEARQCIFRGEATFLRFAGARPVELQLENALLALGERLVEGDVGLTSGRGAAETRIELRHVTALAHSGLVRLTNDGGNAQTMRVRVECFDSILAGRDPSAMIEQVGGDPYDTLSRQLTWSGDRSIYDGFATLWRLQGADALQEYNFRKWQTYWGSQENQTIAGQAGWARLPAPASRALSAYRPSDFELRLIDSRAIEHASDGFDSGAILDDLPPLPDSLTARRE